MGAVLHDRLQEFGSGDELALALKEFSGLVLTKFPEMMVFGNHIWTKSVSSGKEHQFPAVWAMECEEHTPGTDLAGDEDPLMEERLVYADTRQLVGHAWVSELHDFFAHFDDRTEIADQAAKSIAKKADSRLGRCIALGARTAARGPAGEFPAGNVVIAATAGAINLAYPISPTGAKRLRDDFAQMAQNMDEKDVPKGERFAYIDPFLKRVLSQDKTLVSRDYQGKNDMLSRKLVECEGWLIEETNNIPRTLVAAGVGDGGQSSYRGDFTKTVCLFTGDRTAVGQVTFGGIRAFGPTYHEERLSYLLGAKILQGAKAIRPEACGEIQIQ
jgi:hypothetical protein